MDRSRPRWRRGRAGRRSAAPSSDGASPAAPISQPLPAPALASGAAAGCGSPAAAAESPFSDAVRPARGATGRSCSTTSGQTGTRRCWPTKSSTRQLSLPGAEAQAATDLLLEQHRALRRAQQQQRVDHRQVDAFVVEVHCHQRAQFAAEQALRGAASSWVSSCPPRRRPASRHG